MMAMHNLDIKDVGSNQEPWLLTFKKDTYKEREVLTNDGMKININCRLIELHLNCISEYKKKEKL